MARQVIGTGLNALLQQNKPSNIAADDKRIILARVAEIHSSPFQPRRIFNQEQIDELAASIRERGLVQPLVVRRVNGHFELIAGERRLRAVASLGHKEVKVVVLEATDQEVAEITLIENLQREDLSPLEEAEQYRLLKTRFHMKQEVIAQHVGKSRAVVANTMRLLDLCPAVRELLEAEKITVGHAKVLLQLHDDNQQKEAADRVVQRSLTVRQTEKYVHNLLAEEQGEEESIQTVTQAEEGVPYEEICRELSGNLSTRVRITPKGKRGGVIEITFARQTELKRLLEIFGITARL